MGRNSPLRGSGVFPVEPKAKQTHGCCLCSPRHHLGACTASAPRIHAQCVGTDTSHFPHLPFPSCWLFPPGQFLLCPQGHCRVLGAPCSHPSAVFSLCVTSLWTLLSFYRSNLTGLIPLEGLLSQILLLTGKGLGGTDTLK